MKEKMTEASIRKDLSTSFIGQRIIYHTKIRSTMDVAKREALKGAPEGTVVIADEQTEGKGRIGRFWSSPKGCVALSIILYPKQTYLSSLIMVASLAVMRTIKSVTRLHSPIKWPNDVLINGKKVCGILVESGVQSSDSNYAIIGIGINVNLEATCLDDVSSMATSLSNELGSEVSRLKIIRKLLCEIERLYISAKDNEIVYREWMRNLETLGRLVNAKSGDNIYEGIAESVKRDGSLMLRLTDGSLKRFVAGDIILQQ
jgi:BirA family biotin operon repressor/biotin-[acetyl-CoA-carboxylase] ligase